MYTLLLSNCFNYYFFIHNYTCTQTPKSFLQRICYTTYNKILTLHHLTVFLSVLTTPEQNFHFSGYSVLSFFPSFAIFLNIHKKKKESLIVHCNTSYALYYNLFLSTITIIIVTTITTIHSITIILVNSVKKVFSFMWWCEQNY